MVIRLISILLIVGFAATPYWLVASETSRCAESACEHLVETPGEDLSQICCVQDSLAWEDENVPTENDGEPSGDCECPLVCCSLVKSVASVTIKLQKSPALLRVENSVAPALDVCGSPHVKRLKRPPRLLTTTAQV